MLSEGSLLRRAAIAFIALYLVAVAVFAALKAATTFCTTMTWPEVIYGPAITVISSFLLFYVAFRIECRIRDRGLPRCGIPCVEIQGCTNPMSHSAIITIKSRFTHAETVGRFLSVFAEKGITVFATIDHQAAARAAGLTMHPATVIVFGNPRMGTPLMRSNPQIALDLPLKVLIHEPAPGQVVVLYTAASEIVARHPLPDDLAAKLTYADRLINDVLHPNASE
jgi:uncharacterized protein (DUF302 family)